MTSYCNYYCSYFTYLILLWVVKYTCTEQRFGLFFLLFFSLYLKGCSTDWGKLYSLRGKTFLTYKYACKYIYIYNIYKIACKSLLGKSWHFLLFSDRHLTHKKNAYWPRKQSVMLLMHSGMWKRPTQHIYCLYNLQGWITLKNHLLQALKNSHLIIRVSRIAN